MPAQRPGNSKSFFCSPLDEIQQEMKEQKDIERHMRNMSNDLIKLNVLINKNNSSFQELQHGNIITENEFVRALKVQDPRAQPPCRSGAHSDPVNPSHADSVVSVYASQIQAAEKESVEMQERHSQLMEEKERLLKSLLEAE